MAEGNDGDHAERIRQLEIGHGRTEEWKANMFERMKKAEHDLEQIPDIKKDIAKSEIRLALVIGILIFVAQIIFRH